MRKLARDISWHIFRMLSYSLSGAFVVLLAGAILYLNNRPDLSIWHRANLDAEFNEHSPVRSFTEYRALEERLFKQLDTEVYEKIRPADRYPVNRYHRGSLSDPDRWPVNWNRSFELPLDRPAAGVLLLHGLSDSPYSLRGLGQGFHTAGAWVIGLRLPGHGTTPAGLTHTSWRDMAMAVRLAVDHLYEKTHGKPVYIVGYSTGATLAVHYSLMTLMDPERVPIQGLVLIAPAIGVSPAAALAVWQARLGHLLGLEKLEWNTVLPEYDPYKYSSFAINASDQVYRLTQEVQSRLKAMDAATLQRFPPTLAFQSASDATVAAADLTDKFLIHLPPGKHEVVIFDINRLNTLQYLLAHDPAPRLNALLKTGSLPFTVSILTNHTPDSRRLVIHSKAAGETQMEIKSTQLYWPENVYAISHVALPISPRDPLYGNGNTPGASPLQLGNLALRGEKGVLRLSGTDMLRLRWNPFYNYLESKTLDFMELQNLP